MMGKKFRETISNSSVWIPQRLLSTINFTVISEMKQCCCCFKSEAHRTAQAAWNVWSSWFSLCGRWHFEHALPCPKFVGKCQSFGDGTACDFHPSPLHSLYFCTFPRSHSEVREDIFRLRLETPLSNPFPWDLDKFLILVYFHLFL